MKASERAAQLWTVLLFAAFHRQVAELDTLNRLTGAPAPELRDSLESVRLYCLGRGIPDLTCIAVDDPAQEPTARHSDLREKRVAVFQHSWLDEATPTPSDFEPFCPDGSER